MEMFGEGGKGGGGETFGRNIGWGVTDRKRKQNNTPIVKHGVTYSSAAMLSDVAAC
jgi:hypothetical protein